MIADLLGIGKDNATSTAALAEKTGLSVRDLREAVSKERLAGLPICAGLRGYYLPKDTEEVAEYLLFLEKTAKTRLATAKAFRKILRETPGQIELTKEELTA